MKRNNLAGAIPSGFVLRSFLSVMVLAAAASVASVAHAAPAAQSVPPSRAGTAKTTPSFVVRGMLKAVREGKLPLLKSMMKSAPDPDASIVENGLSVTALRLASSMGRAEFVTYLLGRGAKPGSANEEGQTALMMAAENGHDAVVNLLREKGASIEQKDNSGRGAADYAEDAGYTELAAGLKPVAAEPAAKVPVAKVPAVKVTATPATPAAPAPEPVAVATPKPPAAPKGPLAGPVEKPSGQPAKAEPQTPKPTVEPASPKPVAKKPEASPTMTEAPEASKPREFPVPATLAPPAKGKPTPAFMVKTMLKTARDGKVKMLAGILKNGADPNVAGKIDDKVQTPLIAAAEAGRNEIVTLLLENGAAVNLADLDGRTALMVAASKGRRAVAENLIGEGANAALQDENGETAARISQNAGFGDLAAYLERAGREHLAYLPKKPVLPKISFPSLAPAPSVPPLPENKAGLPTPPKVASPDVAALPSRAPTKTADGGLEGIERVIKAEWYTQKDANIRTAPSTKGVRMGTLAGGQPIYVVGVVAGGGWMAVNFSGQRGYVASFLVAPYKPAEARLKTISGKVVVLDTANLIVNGKAIALYGIQGINGALADGMEKFINSQGARANCVPKGKRKYICKTPSGVDIGEAAILNGAARTTFDAPKKYKLGEDKARNNRRGIWN